MMLQCRHYHVYHINHIHSVLFYLYKLRSRHSQMLLQLFSTYDIVIYVHVLDVALLKRKHVTILDACLINVTI